MIWILAFGFAIEENIYFGWHFTPKSDAELICDGLVALLFALAYVRNSIKRGAA